MGSPEIYGSGITPERTDTKRMLLAKKLKALGGSALTSDTKRRLLGKIDRIRSGKSGTNTGF